MLPAVRGADVREVSETSSRARAALMLASAPLRRALHDASFAPSPDNLQPWRFEVRDSDTFVVHGRDPRAAYGPYDLYRHAYWTSLGGLLETIRISAAAHGQTVVIERDPSRSDESPSFVGKLSPAPEGASLTDLSRAIFWRSTQRRAMNPRRLGAAEKAALETSVGSGFQVRWLESPRQRLRAAWVNYLTGKLRLTTPAANQVHQRIVDFGNENPLGRRLSADRVPAGAVGVDRATEALMRWLLPRERLLAVFNQYLAGTAVPGLELDLLPGLATGAHFLIETTGDSPPAGIDDYLAAGAAMQRFWLKATSMGLQLQPTYMPRALLAYSKDRQGSPHEPRFSSDPAGWRLERSIVNGLGNLARDVGAEPTHIIFAGRVGRGAPPDRRSLRLPLDDLLVLPEPGEARD
ncbi:MAG: molybdopterin biosynthesis protein MoeY [Proteobacteria bacterium]|nr:molybdopterin biosynthesis protein MoeY [Pseudomonadota bacterium]